ncbi:hypothetical protein [Ralstonia syzygii]|nr:hypothetical protein [Ralstonia syzygii]
MTTPRVPLRVRIVVMEREGFGRRWCVGFRAVARRAIDAVAVFVPGVRG